MPRLHTTDLKMPLKKDGTVNKVYKYPQFCKKNGTHNHTTKLTSEKKKYF